MWHSRLLTFVLAALVLGASTVLGAAPARACGCEPCSTVVRKLHARVLRVDRPNWSIEVEWLDAADGLPTRLALAPALTARRRTLVVGAAVMLSLRVQDGQTTVFAAER